MVNNMDFGKRLKMIRKLHNVTQQELADALNISRSTIAGYETKGKEPDYATLIRISDYFHISVDNLLRESIKQSNSVIVSCKCNNCKEIYQLPLFCPKCGSKLQYNDNNNLL